MEVSNGNFMKYLIIVFLIMSCGKNESVFTDPIPSPTVDTSVSTPVPTSEPKEEDEVVICHKPGKNQQTLVVLNETVQDHLDHGDYLGECL